jgi:hypothetical protein
MGCGCLVALAALVSPRFAIFLIWLFHDRLEVAFDSGWVGFAGFLFLPWTTLTWAVAYSPEQGVTGFGWFLVIFAFLVDLASYGSGERARRTV